MTIPFFGSQQAQALLLGTGAGSMQRVEMLHCDKRPTTLNSRLLSVVLWCLPVLSICFGLAGCGNSGVEAESGGPLKIVVTTSMVGDLVRHVAGDHASVVGLMGEGVDPHLYRATSRDLGSMMQADLIFYSGLGLEGAMQSALERVEKNGKKTTAVTASLPREKLIHSQRFSGHPDPHVWNDAGLWLQCLDEVVRVLAQADPEHAKDFETNAERYRQELKNLDEYARTAIGSIPEKSRYLVTAHDAFAYFSAAYHLQERSVQGITTESEPGIQDINNLVDFLVSQRVPALFVEATVNSTYLKAVIEGARQRGWTVREGGMLYSDSTGAPGAYEGTYVGMLDHNVTTVTRALGGDAPERGWQGKLGEKQ